MLDSNHQWSSLKILHAHTGEILEKRIDIKGISQLGKWAFPLPAALGETDNKSNNKSLFPTLQTERERAIHLY